MFTGLVQSVGEVVKVQRGPKSVRLTVRLPGEPTGKRAAKDSVPSFPTALGDSISVSGCCLTIAAAPKESGTFRDLEFDAVAETLSKTTLGTFRVGSKVNLEHSVLPTTLMGGHIVQGHVDCTGTVRNVKTGEDWRIRISPDDASMMAYIVPKGSITVDGVSLTIAALLPTAFEVALIPTTLAKTTLASLASGDKVNLEMDMIVKTIVNHLRTIGVSPSVATGPPPAPPAAVPAAQTRRSKSTSTSKVRTRKQAPVSGTSTRKAPR